MTAVVQIGRKPPARARAADRAGRRSRPSRRGCWPARCVADVAQPDVRRDRRGHLRRRDARAARRAGRPPDRRRRDRHLRRRRCCSSALGTGAPQLGVMVVLAMVAAALLGRQRDGDRRGRRVRDPARHARPVGGQAIVLRRPHPRGADRRRLPRSPSAPLLFPTDPALARRPRRPGRVRRARPRARSASPPASSARDADETRAALARGARDRPAASPRRASCSAQPRGRVLAPPRRAPSRCSTATSARSSQVDLAVQQHARARPRRARARCAPGDAAGRRPRRDPPARGRGLGAGRRLRRPGARGRARAPRCALARRRARAEQPVQCPSRAGRPGPLDRGRPRCAPPSSSA